MRRLELPLPIDVNSKSYEGSSFLGTPSGSVTAADISHQKILIGSNIQSPAESYGLKKSVKINNICKKQREKIKNYNKDKVQKFEERMKVFENCNTFIDIKDYLKQMNLVNKSQSRDTRSLPPILIKNAQISNLQELQQSGFIIKSPDSNSMSSSSMGMNPNIDYSKALEHAKFRISKLSPRSEKTSMSIFAQTTAEYEKPPLETTIDESALILNEESDYYEFYSKPIEAFVKEKNIHIRKQAEDQEELERIKSHLKSQPVCEVKIDDGYYKDYKHRADKIIKLLKVVSKKVLNRTIKSGPKFKRMKSIEKREKKKETLRELHPKFDQLLSSGRFLKSIVEPEAEVGALTSRFQKMEAHVKKLSEYQQESSFSSRSTENLRKRTVSTSNNFNHQINKIHNNFINTLITQARTTESGCKNVKLQVQKNMEAIKQERELNALKNIPDCLKTVSVPQIERNASMEFFMRRNISKAC